MFKFSVFAALMAIGSVVLLAGTASANNMVTNPGFETGHFTAWKSYGSWRISNNPADVHSGKYAAVNNLTVSVGTTSTTYSGLYQNVSDPNAAGQAFNASAWISTAATNGYSKSFFQVQFQNTSGKVLKQYDTTPVTADHAYAQYSLSDLVAPRGTAIIQVQGVVEGIGGRTPASNNTGYTRFDDFSLAHVAVPGKVKHRAAAYNGGKVSLRQDRFLLNLEHRCFRYFWDEMNPRNGLAPNRTPVAGGPAPVASIAATGFGLTALCIADEHHWEPHAEIYKRVLRTLVFFRYKAQSAHGFYYHFLGMRSGRRLWHCSASSIDTALLMAGVLTVRQHFAGTAAARVATSIYRRVDWPWMLNSNFMPNGEKTLAMGWRPSSGFIHYNWFQFNEGPLIYLLGIGSSTHPLPPKSWSAWRRGPLITYGGYTFMNGTPAAPAPLFTHQYPQGWFNLRGLCDRYADYFRDSRYATRANRTMCMNLAKRFPDYGPNSWGLSASLSPSGYRVWGEPPPTLTGPNAINGTLVPCA
ncbi:MAG: glucoamylase family protein, partial [Phycisphaerae bacterium]